MSGIASATRPLGGLIDRIGAAPLWAWWLGAFVLIATQGLAQNAGEIAQNWGDADDATRMVQVRSWLAGGSWFDTNIAQIGLPGQGLASHWSRLVDLPIAALILSFAVFMPLSDAEVLTRAIYPLLVLLPLLVILAQTVDRTAGRLAAIIALFFAMTTITALMQFSVGRIDHHNMQILGAVGSVLLLWTMPMVRYAGWLSALLAGFSIAVGYEGLPIVATSAAAAALWAVFDRRIALCMRDYALVLPVTLVILFAATTAPAAWHSVKCDALAANLIVLVVIGGAGLTGVLTRGQQWSWITRLGVLAGAGVVGLLAYAGLEPACLAGPYGQMPHALHALWLDHVPETQSLLSFGLSAPAQGLTCLTFLAVAAVAHLAVLRRHQTAPSLFLTATYLISAVLALWQIKYLSYASWLAIPGLAFLLAEIKSAAGISAVTLRFSGLTLLNQYTLTLAIIMLLSPLVRPTLEPSPVTGAKEACFTTDNVGALGALPRGLIVADIDLGAFIAASTDHAVLSAPYHRIGQAMIENEAIQHAGDLEAHTRLKRLGARYVATCLNFTRPLLAPKTGVDQSLTARLRRGDIPDYLEPMTLAPGTPLRAWRITP